MVQDIRINGLNGYTPKDPCNLSILEKLGIERLTALKDIDQVDANPETLLENILAERFPGGYNNSEDLYCIIRRSGIQYALIVHWGQWFIGENAADEKTGELVRVNLTDRCSFYTEDENRTFVKAIIEYLHEKQLGAVRFDPKSFADPDDIPYCRSFNSVIDTVSTNSDGATLTFAYDIDGYLFNQEINGSEDEDFDFLFESIYNELRDPEKDPESDEWLHQRFGKAA